jgi:MFS family permease
MNRLDPKINKVIWLLTFNDITTWGVYFVFSILIGIYLAGKLEANTAEIIGIGSGLYFFARGITQLPIGRFGDGHKSLLDELVLLMVGNLLMGLPIFFTVFITAVWQYYLLMAIFGIGTSLNLINWRKIFAGSLDKGREGLDYAIYETVMSLATGVLTILSGTIASLSREAFDIVIMGVGIAMVLGNVWLIYVYWLKKDDRKF